MSRSRTVNDYRSTRSLRKALASVEEEGLEGDDELLHISDYEVNTDTPAASASKFTSNNSNSDPNTELNANWDWVLTNYDVGTTMPQSISQELHRLQVLKSYMILDEDREDAFERLTDMASRVFQVPIALISLVDLGRQWFLSNHGLGDVRETPRNLAFCAHAVQGRNKLFIVPNALEDPRFCDSPLVQGAPFIRFYAGAPLLSPEGYKLGTFCIIDSKPRPDGLSEDDQANLIDFAAMAMKAMADRRQITSQDATAHLVACTAHDLLTPLMGVQLSLSLLEDEAAEKMSDTHRESLSNAIRSSDWLQRICQTTIQTLRDTKQDKTASAAVDYPRHPEDIAASASGRNAAESPFIDMREFVASLNQTMESIPKRVPLVLNIDDSVPAKIVSDDLKLFRSSLNLLSNALAHTSSGSVQFHVYAASDEEEDGPAAGWRRYSFAQQQQQHHQFLVFQCTDTGPDLQIKEEDIECLFKPCKKSLGVVRDLGLYSLAYQIDSLGGSYGYQSRRDTEEKEGSVFWFQVPIVLPEDISVVSMLGMANSINNAGPTACSKGIPRTIGLKASNNSLGNLGMLDAFSGNASVATLDSSVILHPVGAHLTIPSYNNQSSVAHKRHMSFSEGLDLAAANRSGILAVAAASMCNRSTTGSTSCCGLDELSKFGGSIEDYKEEKRRRRERSKSPVPSRSTTASILSPRSAVAAGPRRPRRTSANAEPNVNDGASSGSRARTKNTNAGLRRSRTADDTEPLRAPRALLTKKEGVPLTIQISNEKEESTKITDLTPPLFVMDKPAKVLVSDNSPPSKGQPLLETTQSPATETDEPDGVVDKKIPTLKVQTLLGPKLEPGTEPPPTLVAEKSGGLFSEGPQAKVQAQQPAVNPKPEPATCSSGRRQKKALVIEDTLVVRKTLTRALQKRGYVVSQANDGLEGLAALKQTVFDITLCDFLMPNMDGLDCVQQYRQWEKENRGFQQYIVGISAHVSHKDVDKGLEIGMDDFRPKPITIKTLEELDTSPKMEQVRAVLTKADSSGNLVESSRKNGTKRGAQSSDLCSKEKESAPERKSCLMATVRSEGASGETARRMTKAGWDVTIVEDGPSALEKLKCRNWGAVILEDQLPGLTGNRCVEEFRAWEGQNRVNRQDNLFIVCTDVVLSNPETCMLPPAGFDGAVDGQVSWKLLQSLIEKQKNSQPSTRQGLSIVTR